LSATSPAPGRSLQQLPEMAEEWPRERIDELVRLVKEKLMAGEIAQRMHLSRNAIIGKVHRLARKPEFEGLKFAHKPFKYERARQPKAKAETTMATNPPEPRLLPVVRKPESPGMVTPVVWVPPKPTAPGEPITLMTRDPWMCKWPVGRHNGQTTFCGQLRAGWSQHSTDETATPYCESHHRLSYAGTGNRAVVRPRPHFVK